MKVEFHVEGLTAFVDAVDGHDDVGAFGPERGHHVFVVERDAAKEILLLWQSEHGQLHRVADNPGVVLRQGLLVRGAAHGRHGCVVRCFVGFLQELHDEF